jgi:DNA-binding transcriptional LysR family regulator
VRNLDRLRCFLAVVEHGQVSTAADALGHGPSVVSQRVRQLEQEWGVSLFVRVRGRLVLSDAGRALLPLARDVASQLAALDATAAQLAAGHRGELTIAYRHNAGGWVTRLTRAVTAERPGVGVKPKAMEHHDVIAAVTGGEADLGIAGPDDAVESFPLGEEPLSVLAAPATHRLARAEHVTIHDLDGEPYVLDDRSDHDRPRRDLVEFFDAHGVTPDYRLATIGSAQDLLTLVGVGAGLALVRSSFAVAGQLAENLAFRPMHGATPTIVDALLWRRANPSPLVRWAASLVRTAVAGRPAA